MVSLFSRLVRQLIQVSIYILLACFLSVNAFAHGGHDHGDDEKPLVVEQEVPRLTVESELFQVVGVNDGNKLTLYLDEYATNAPIENALIEITKDADTFIAKEVSPTVYAIDGEWLHEAGKHDLVISVTAGENIDLLLAELIVSAPKTDEDAKNAQGWKAYLQPELAIPLLIAGGIGLLVGLFFRNAVFPTTTATLLFLIFTPADTAIAHEGHDHGAEEKQETVSNGSQPQRLPNGSVYLPKPSQRLLKIRTNVAEEKNQARSNSLLGRVVADPTNKAVVQAVRDGRIEFPTSGPPVIGQQVTKGDMIARLIPILSPESLAGLAEQIGSLDQEIALTKQRLKNLNHIASVRVSGQGATSLSAVSKTQITELEVTLVELTKRRDKINAVSFGPVELIASSSGTVTTVTTQTGQVVSAGDTLIEMIDPQRVWVEAIAYPGQPFDENAKSSVVLEDQSVLPLSFVSRSASLTAQAQTAFFKLEKEQAVPLGTPVTVVLESSEEQNSLLLPRDAVVRGSSGLQIVWVQEAPERFRPQIVETETFDSINILILRGVSPGDRVVTEGASFLNQVR